MSNKIVNNFKTIQKLSEGTFNHIASFEQLERLRTFENNVHDMDIEFPSIDFKTTINDKSLIQYVADLGNLELPLNNKALGDVFQKSLSPTQIGDFRRLGSIVHPNDPLNSVGEILLEDAKMNPKNQEGHTAIIFEQMIRSFVGRNYPTVAKTGIHTADMINATLDMIPAMESIRHLPEGVETQKPLFECKFNEETGSTHGKIVYDVVSSDFTGVEVGKPFAMGVSFGDNHYGAGKQFVTALMFSPSCMNGMMSRESLAGFVATHTSVQNMVQGYLKLMSPVWGFGGNPDELGVLGTSQQEVTAIMTRLQLIIADWKKALFKGKDRLPVIDADYQETFYKMLAMGIVKYSDYRRTIEIDVIKNSTAIEIKDIMKELDKLRDKKLLTGLDNRTIVDILGEDPTIPEELKNTAYGLGSAITRYANNFQASNDDKYNDLQVLGRNVMEVIPTVNYSRRKGTAQANTY